MPDTGEPTGDNDAKAPVRPRLKLDLDFVPDQTSDDLATSWGDVVPDEAARRQSYLSEKPPHHGD